MSAPAYLIWLELEAAPRVVVDALHEGDYDRLADWLLANPDIAELLERAVALAQRERAA